MRVRVLVFTGIAAAGALATGCAPAPKDPGFADVQKNVLDRTGQHVDWNRRTADDKAVAASVHALLKEQLTADHAVQIALLNNRGLQAQYEDIGIAQADLVQAGLLKNPVFNAAVEFGDGGKGTKLQFSVVEDFISILQIPMRKKIAGTMLTATKARVAGAVIDLAGQTRTAFYSAQATEQLLELRRTVAAATDASFDLAQRIHAAGNSTDLDVANEQVLREQAKMDLAVAEAEARRARERLNILMGLSGDDLHWTLPPRLADAPVDEVDTQNVERTAVQRSLDLDVARSEMISAAQMLGIKKNYSLLADAELGASSEKEIDGTWETGPAVSVPIPIFDQGQAAKASARSRLAQSRQRYYALAIEVRAAARMARDEVLAARAKVDQYHKVILPLRHQIVEKTQDRYNGMLIGPFQLLQARRDEIAAGVEYVDALRDYWIARARLEQLLSGRMEGH